MQKKNFNFKIKSVDAQDGTFQGMGAIYSNEDLGGDVILPGAFTRTLQGRKSWPLLWQHDPSNPIGSADITDTAAGLQVNGSLQLDDPTAQKAYTFMKSGIVKGLSIGFETLQSKMDGDVRQLQELRLWELSVVTFPMNQSAQISSVKAITDEERTKHLKALDDGRKGIDRIQRKMRVSLKALGYGLDDDDEDDPTGDDPALLESSDDGPDPDEEMSKAIIAELNKLVLQAKTIGGIQ